MIQEADRGMLVSCVGVRDYCLLRKLISDEQIEEMRSSGKLQEILNLPGSFEMSIVGDVRDNCEGNCERSLLAARIYTPRQLEQFRCVDDYKYMKSQELGRNIGDDAAWRGWVTEGYAKEFAEIWEKTQGSQTIRHWDLYVKVVHNSQSLVGVA